MDINYRKYLNTTLTVEKVVDNKFGGNHPNGHNPGFKMNGCIINLTLCEEMQYLFVVTESEWFHTSTVVKQEEFEGYDLLHTLNSTYKVTPEFSSITGVQEKHSLSVLKQFYHILLT